MNHQLRTILIFVIIVNQSFAWQILPPIPSGRRSQFLVLGNDGSYKYGYDTGDGLAAKQISDPFNQVAGNYFYKNKDGQNIEVKYTAGVQGFVPEITDNLLSAPKTDNSYFRSFDRSSSELNKISSDDQTSGDASYNFNIDTDTYKRQETSDARGNVRGRYTYVNPEGTHDVTYTAGENTGFVARSGSVSPSSISIANPDGSYAFSYSTGDSYRQESADAGNNVQGKYFYKDAAGIHDLSYVAGAQTGFLATGGNLAKPNSWTGFKSARFNPFFLYPSSVPFGSSFNDGSYSFEHAAPLQYRQELVDSNGHVYSRDSVVNGAGSSTRLLPVTNSGSAATKFPEKDNPVDSSEKIATKVVNGAGSSTGLLPMSNSESAATKFPEKDNPVDSSEKIATKASQPNPNLVESFVQKKDAFDVTESSDNVTAPNDEDSRSEENSTSLNIENIDEDKHEEDSRTEENSTPNIENNTDEENSGDASYSFAIDTDDYKRYETSDPNGNIRGGFSYKNSVGNHDLNFVAGSGTGFIPTSGSLKGVPGLDKNQLEVGGFLARSRSHNFNNLDLVTKESVSPTVDKSVVIRSYPSNIGRKKFGYSFDTL